MNEMQRNGSHSSDGTPGPSRSVYRKNAKDQAGVKTKGSMKLPIRSSARESARRVGSVHGVADESSEDDPSPRPRRRGHDYRSVQARENGRMHLGDNTYITTQNLYSEQKWTPEDREDGRQLDLVDALAFERMETRLASISAAQDETCRWLFDTSEYVQWREGIRRSRHRFLWIKGKPGSGKSTLMATAFQQASGDFKHSVVASFFFNARGDELSRTTEGMYRSLLHQIFSQLPELPPGIPSQVDGSLKRSGWELSTLQNMLRTTLLHLEHSQSLVCYIDALDECAEDEIRDALQHLESLRDLAKSRNTKFLICVASRHYPNITVKYHRAIDLYKQVEHNHDISKYVKSTLRVSGALGSELHDSLMARCGGIFLWVLLTVKGLNKLYDQGGTRSKLRARMREAPDEVHDLFREILRHRDEHLLPILLWTLFAMHPLTVRELYFAVQSSSGRLSTGVWNSAEIDIPGMQNFLLDSSKGLIEFPSAFKTHAQLIHESLREYLLNGGLSRLDDSMESNVRSIGHARLATWCVEYIAADSEQYTAGAFQHDKYNLGTTLPLFGYAMYATTEHMEIAREGNVIPRSTLERFTNLWLTCKLDLLNNTARADCAALLYNSLVRDGDRYETTSFGRARIVLKEPERTLGTLRPGKWELDRTEKCLQLQPAAQAGSIDLPKLFANREWDPDFHKLVEPALFRSAAEGQERVLELLLHYAHPSLELNLCQALLWVAVTNLQESTARVMLRYGAVPSSYELSVLRAVARRPNPLRYDGDAARARNGRIRIATMLLDYGADTKGALLSAAKARRLPLMRLLTARGATFSQSEIRTAQQRGRTEILDLAHKAGAAIGDSASEFAYTSESVDSDAAVVGYY